MKNKRAIPHTYVIVFYIIVIAAILTWIVPGGAFERQQMQLENGTVKEVIDGTSFQYIDASPQTWQVFSALFDGFVDKADIIVFILLIGGAFWIMNESKAIDVGILSFLTFSKKLEHIWLFKKLGINNIILTFIMLLFSVFGAVFGMSEETIAFIIIFVPLAISMGYDSIVGVSLCFVAAALGFAGALLNPFTIGIAQGLSGLPLFSGIEYRFFSWIVINFVGIAWILRYANKIHKNPKLSIVYEEDAYWRKADAHEESANFIKSGKSAWISFGFIVAVLLYFSYAEFWSVLQIGNASYRFPALPAVTAYFIIFGIMGLRKSIHFYILNLLGLTILMLIVGVMGYAWYVMEIASLFFAMGLASGIAMNYSPNKITNLFLAGVKDITSAAMVVGLAGGIIIILNNGQIIDTLLYYVSRAMGDFGKLASVELMYVFQTGINVIIPSGSAKAALTMPIMSQFSDLIGVSRQATVMAFQFGDGFTNMITPTSGILIGVLGVARIPYEKWVKWAWPFILMLTIVGALLLIPTVYMKLNGF